ncbi:DUF3310 domain-containing protein [Spartinivicinus marinus]|uniref:DUF3310 domain-containing protein n=1 Tax=Spartinivicinus marinus TaxID=2994442 RepID=UPI002252986C|nr:DUF3310 domain-containing protein [Spartinivicinus marinus]MCX4024759.1 DUF3310 domain-containing protein [Spartinivicinus marinus]
MNFNIGDVVAPKDSYFDNAYREGITPSLHRNRVYKVADTSPRAVHLEGEGIYFSGHFETISENTSSEATVEKAIQYKFNEPDYFKELEQYVDSTYSQHYASKGVQTAELIFADAQRGLHYTLSNIVKYADRFGKKDGKNRQDLLKIAHYTIHALHCLDKLEDNNG